MALSDSSRMKSANAIGGIGAVIVGVLLLVLITAAIDPVEAGYRGVRTRFGKVIAGALDPGLHFKIPWIEKITDVEVREDKMQLDTSASSRDLQMVKSQIVVNFHPVPEKVELLFNEVGLDYKSRVLDPAVEETVKAVTAQYTAEELISKRTAARQAMESMLSDRLAVNHLEITKFNIVNFEFSESFNEAIEAKQTAEQEALRAENDLLRVKVEADQKIEEARGRAESVKLEALAAADAIRAKAAAEAESIRIKAEAEANAHETLSAVIDRDVIQLRSIEKWNGIVPRVTGEVIPMLDLGPEPEPTTPVSSPIGGALEAAGLR